MDTSTQAQLFLADQRGCSETGFFRSYHVFNFGSYTAEARDPFGTLRVLNDNTLAAGHGITMRVEQPTDILILPLLGGLEYKSAAGNGFLETGQAQLFSLSNGMDYAINNPYETESINYLEIWFTRSSPALTPTITRMPIDLSLAITHACLCFHLIIPVPRTRVSLVDTVAGRRILTIPHSAETACSCLC